MWSKRAAMFAAIVIVSAAPARAADPTGIWFTKDSEARVQIFTCGQALCGKIISLKEPNDPKDDRPKLDKFNKDQNKRSRPLIGLQIMSSLKPSGTPDQWQGSLYNPEDGNTYQGKITIQSEQSLSLQGCVLSLFCKSEIWKRTN
jgi:uncharacterized protein (DUF2147 family)